MPLKISRLRFWFGAAAIVVCAIVAGAYFRARSQVENALKEVPEKIGIQIQQSAQGFTITKSDAGHMLFKIQASKAVKYNAGGRVELHNVAITVYGRDSNRFDQISGDDFTYDPQSGDVTAQGQVKIDLDADLSADPNIRQASGKDRGDAIHLQTSGLVFNQKTGNAHTPNQVDFEIPRAQGSAVGADYNARSSVLILLSQVNLSSSGSDSATLSAQSASINKKQRTITFIAPRIQRGSERLTSQKIVMLLRPDNTAERVLASGDVHLEDTGKENEKSSVQSAELNLELAPNGKSLTTAIFAGDVSVNSLGKLPSYASAQKIEFNFANRNVLQTAHAEGDVELKQEQPARQSAAAQELEVTAPALDLAVAGGQRLRSAVTSGPSQITIRPAKAKSGQEILVDASQFVGKFNSSGQLISLHGDRHTRIIGRDTGQPDRISTSDSLDAILAPQGGIQSVVQKGHLEYSDGSRKAWADQGRYTPAAQMLVLTGHPRVVEAGVTTTADVMKLNRATGEADASGDVKTTYSDLKAQPNGALLASSSPIHVTAENMAAHNSPAIAVYTGNVRLWQDANVVQAPRIQFDRDRRDIVASGTPADPVSTVLVQTDGKGKVMPVTITSPRLIYTNRAREVRLDDGVNVKGDDAILTAQRMDILLEPPSGSTANKTGLSGKVQKIVAEGSVVVRQDARKATGDQLTYTPADGKFIMTGKSPCIFDAEHGKITGVSLTFFGHDDTVLVEGSRNSPSVTRARVAR